MSAKLLKGRSFRLTATAVACGLVLLAPAAGARQAGQAAAPQARVERLMLLAGRSIVLDTPFPIDTFQITNPDIADVVVRSQRELILNGKTPGTISLWLWGTAGQRLEYEVVVDPGITTLQQNLQMLFPGEEINVSVSQGAILLSGRVSSNQIMLKAVEIAAASAPQGRVINLLQLPGGEGSQQVMLQVRFAEVNSRAVRELGVSLFTTRTGFTARSTTQQFPAPDFDDDQGAVQGLVFSDYLNLFFFQRSEGIGGVMRALQQNGWFESLAEPNLIAYNGQKASFLAGGEFPVIAATGNGAASVTFKEYGVKLEFTPTIAGDTIRLHVRPEVSALDFANGVSVAGFRVPALTTRYAETDVELRDGQSFAIAGLLDHVGQEDKQAIPLLSQIPIIGKIFQSKANRDNRTELLVLITPRLVRPLNPDEVPPLPSIIRTPPSGGRGGGGGTGGGAVADHLKGGAGLIDAPIPGRSGRE